MGKDWAGEIAKLEYRPNWAGINSPWRRLAALKPGQSWFELPEPNINSQSQIYVKQDLTPPIPPEAAAALELVSAGATESFAIENWHGLGVMRHNMKGVDKDCHIWNLIEQYKRQSGKKRGGGFPDVVAFWPDGKVSICEVKVKGGDRLNPNQLAGARHFREILGDRLDLRVFEWHGEKASERI